MLLCSQGPQGKQNGTVAKSPVFEVKYLHGESKLSSIIYQLCNLDVTGL